MTRRLALLLSAPLVVVAIAACPASRTEGLDPSSVPENVRADYDLFARRCSKCHTLARPLNAGITDDEQWVMYVNRMRRQPGSGISYDDQLHILRFLKWYAAEQRIKKAGGVVDAAPPDAAPPDAAAADAGAPLGARSEPEPGPHREEASFRAPVGRGLGPGRERGAGSGAEPQHEGAPP